MSDLDFFRGPKGGYVLGLHERLPADPSSVDASSRTAARLNPLEFRAAPTCLAVENLAFAHRARHHEDFDADPVGDGLTLRYEGRPLRASPVEGFSSQHLAEQMRIVQAAWERATAPAAEWGVKHPLQNFHPTGNRPRRRFP